jgi:hypothetical protein
MPTKKSTKPAEYDDLLKRIYVAMINGVYPTSNVKAVVCGDLEPLYTDAFFDAKLATETFFRRRAEPDNHGDE